ncbi:DUF411 domain-containing protein [Ochrobactrum sp. CM-21-5]|nr:DUF411 domain-containing protein [Ochrobactrum sp. CM-21-5]MBC2884884.1 DUF411 domain-containing protein [Ochrobactrum sp. CM-21-5]
MPLRPAYKTFIGGLIGLTALTASAYAQPVTADGASLPHMTMYKDPYCGCCEAWADHMKAAGFQVTVKVEEAMGAVKAKYGVAPNLSSCHTAIVDDYVIEGHVPAASVKQLLKERPKAIGLTTPGMPMGSPGMEMPGSAPDTYDVLLFDGETAKPFARYQGTKAL